MNRHIVLLAVLVMTAVSSPVAAQGYVENRTFYSPSAHMNRTIRIYLPDSYNAEDTTVSYPTVYFLHGGGANHLTYEEIVAALDTLIGTEIHPVILVRPDGYFGPYWGMTWWSNSELNGNFEDFVVDDVIDFMETHYNVFRDGGKRCLIGHSMGGYGAVKLALKHPDRFRAVASHSGVVHLSYAVVNHYIPLMLEESGGSGPFNPDAGDFSKVMFSLARALSPNINHPPFLVDLPCGNDGSIIDSIFLRWRSEDPAQLVSEYDPSDGLGIFLDAPIGDGAFPIINSTFVDSLTHYGIPYSFELYGSSSHWEDLPSRYPLCLHFLDSLMWSAAASADEPFSTPPRKIRLGEVFPTPCNGIATVSFEVDGDVHATFSLFNMLGRRVGVLADHHFSRGDYTIPIGGTELPSGTYFLHAAMDNQSSAVRKVVLIR